MIKYRIQVTIEASRLPEIVNLLYGDQELKFDPELKIYPLLNLGAGVALTSRPHPVEPRPAKRLPKTDRRGISRQAALEGALATGPKRWSELRKAIEAAGLPQGTLNSLISNWQKSGKIERSPNGLWALVKHEQVSTVLHSE